ncbi:bifunctional lysine-specific demethylase and histidyl-hydroxylase NO66-like [Elysia marginata]|uniref:Bifunctional lysine-specific demethylase and histidyl-hydroxylase n=1 Tax=Elysia marginata TaxID=1093978 RepID=A0AAV4JR40_9GAST|nr:bifunctional lysine-specific demethylase and histidyl-hydroxylase NO66-like [Elysia marginata]
MSLNGPQLEQIVKILCLYAELTVPNPWRGVANRESLAVPQKANAFFYSFTANPSPKVTPVTRKSPREKNNSKALKETPILSRKAVQNSITSLTTKSPKKPMLKTSQSLTNANEEMPARNSSRNSIRTTKNEKRRKESESSSASGIPKKRKTDVGDLVNKIEKVEANATSDLPYMFDSTEEARKLFECIIHPVKPDRFFSELWEKKPLLVKRHTSNYNRSWFSTAEFDKILRQENIQWGVNLDATSFVNDKRETHNQTGRAHAPVVWDMYQAGCSMRLLNPQTYSRNVWKVLSVLQEYFGCCVGANIYLTPPGTQGFAPHFDDIEAFILQLEGKKHWRLYSPRNDDEVLPRFSSGNFSQSEFGEPILDTVLEAGDLLYFPRGTIHQGDATDEHSLHITVSCYQMNTWGDLLMKLLPSAIEMAIEENPAFRVGLPRNFLNYMGIVHSEKDLPERKEFVGKLQSLIGTLMESLPVDAACDQMGKQLMVDSMPPVLSEVEKSCSVHAAGERWDPQLKRVLGVSELQPETTIKLIRRGCLRSDRRRIYSSEFRMRKGPETYTL